MSKILGNSCLIAHITQLNIVLNYSFGQENKTIKLVCKIYIYLPMNACLITAFKKAKKLSL